MKKNSITFLVCDMQDFKINSKENSTKNRNIQRLENTNLENKLEIRRKQLNEKIRELKAEQIEIINELNLFQKEIESLKAETEVLENYNKFVEGAQNHSTHKKVEQLRGLKRQTTDTKEVLFFASSQLQKEVLQREKDLQTLKNDIDNKKAFRDSLKNRLNEIKDEIKLLKQENEGIKNKLMLHYHTLLSEGIDTRQEGLVWIIKSIWNLGYNVIMSYMPNYLDEHCIDFLFSIAHKDYELQKMRNEIEDIKNKLKNSFFEVKGYNSPKRKARMSINMLKSEIIRDKEKVKIL